MPPGLARRQNVIVRNLARFCPNQAERESSARFLRQPPQPAGVAFLDAAVGQREVSPRPVNPIGPIRHRPDLPQLQSWDTWRIRDASAVLRCTANIAIARNQ